MKIALIIVAAVVAMWLAFIFLGKITYWLGSYLNKKKDLSKLKKISYLGSSSSPLSLGFLAVRYLDKR